MDVALGWLSGNLYLEAACMDGYDACFDDFGCAHICKGCVRVFANIDDVIDSNSISEVNMLLEIGHVLREANVILTEASNACAACFTSFEHEDIHLHVQQGHEHGFVDSGLFEELLVGYIQCVHAAHSGEVVERKLLICG